MTKAEKIFDITYSAMLCIYVALIIFSFVFSYTSKAVTNITFYNIYVVLGVVSFVGCIAAVIFHGIHRSSSSEQDDDDPIPSAVYLSDTTPERILSNLWVRVILWGAVSIITLIALTVAGSVIPVPNPYGTGEVGKTALEAHPFWSNVYSVAIVPSIFEEACVFFFCAFMTTGLLYLTSRLFDDEEIMHNTVFMVLFGLVGVTVGSYLFTAAHSMAYGLDGRAFWSAFIFEWIVQICNQLTGIFLSWVPHFLHNFGIVFKDQLSFSIGGSLAAAFPWFFEFKPVVRIALSDSWNLLVSDYKKVRRMTRWA